MKKMRWGGEDEGEVMKKEYGPDEIVKKRRKLGLVGWDRNNKNKKKKILGKITY